MSISNQATFLDSAPELVSTVPTIQFELTGFKAPEEKDIVKAVYDDYNAAFGGNLNPALETPQGQLIASTSAIIADANNVFMEFVNQIDPDTASGFMQDAIGRIYFLDRHPATSSVVACQCGGLAGTLIPKGSLVSDTQDNIYESTADATIGLNGTVTVSFSNLQTGPIACAAASVVKIYRAVIGWDSVNNNVAGVLGSDVESRADFEYRRRQSVAMNSRGSLASIYAAVFELEGVIDVYATENTSGYMLVKGATNYPLLPHSLYVAVVGGDSDQVAQTIWTKKDVGCDYNGNTTVIVTDSSYSQPQPSYEVKFHTPAMTPVYFNVQIARNPALSSTLDAQIQAAIVKAFNGSDGGSRARIGSTIFASRFYAGISAIDPRVEIVSIQIGLVSFPNSNSVTLGIDQAPSISISDINVIRV